MTIQSLFVLGYSQAVLQSINYCFTKVDSDARIAHGILQ